MDRRIADDGFRLSAKGIASGLAITELCEVAIFLLHVLRYHRLYFTTPQLQTLYVMLGYDNILIHQNNIMVHCTQTYRTSRISTDQPRRPCNYTRRDGPMTFQNRNFQLKRSYNNIIRIVDVPLHIGRSPINKYAKIKWMFVTKYKTVVHDITVQHYIANLGQCKRACTTADFYDRYRVFYKATTMAPLQPRIYALQRYFILRWWGLRLFHILILRFWLKN